MKEYLVEAYVPERGVDALAGTASRARAAARELASEGGAVRYVHSILVPADDTCFQLYEADSAELVEEASRRAGLTSARVVLAFHATERAGDEPPSRARTVVRRLARRLRPKGQR